MSKWQLILWGFILLIIIIRLLRPIIKGIIGETAVSLVLKFLNKKDYKVLHNITLYVNGYKSQIDHIIVSNFGVFVIETKHYKGWILGHEYSQYWTQVIFRYKGRLYNPILQNKGHVKSLKGLLQHYPDIKYIPIVVFTWRATLKITVSSKVIKIFSLLKTIKQHNHHTLTDAAKNEIFDLIKLNNRKKPPKPSETYHLHPSAEQQAPDLEKCPSCSGLLLIRDGKHGKFKGCSGFPKCRYTKAV